MVAKSTDVPDITDADADSPLLPPYTHGHRDIMRFRRNPAPVYSQRHRQPA